MNLLICVLLLSFYTYNCINTNQTNGSSTTEAKPVESMQTKLGYLRRNLLILVGFIIIFFVFTCFCFLHYNCISDDAAKAEMGKKKGMASNSCKISFSEDKTTSQLNPEKQSLLSTIDKISEHSSSENSSSSAEKLIKPSSLQKPSIQNRARKLTRPSYPKKSPKSSCPKKLCKSSHLEKSHRSCSLEKFCKLAYACKLASSDKSVRQPLLSKPLCSSHPQDEISSPEPFSLQKLAKPPLAKPPKHFNPKRSVSPGGAVLSSNPQLAKTCQSHKERCLISKTYKPLVNDISEAKKKNTQNPCVSSKVKSFSRSSSKLDSRNNAHCDHANDRNKMKCYTENDSDREVTLMCNSNEANQVTLND
uniref:Chromosome X open reading frame 66 n=1 Tax=Cebus imitator TaxID=2715852 RepID=A0A2K5S4V1_CEBIM